LGEGVPSECDRRLATRALELILYRRIGVLEHELLPDCYDYDHVDKQIFRNWLNDFLTCCCSLKHLSGLRIVMSDPNGLKSSPMFWELDGLVAQKARHYEAPGGGGWLKLSQMPSKEARPLDISLVNFADHVVSKIVAEGKIGGWRPCTHKLKLLVTDRMGICDLCNCTFKPKTLMYSCRECDYDECKQCHERKKDSTDTTSISRDGKKMPQHLLRRVRCFFRGVHDVRCSHLPPAANDAKFRPAANDSAFPPAANDSRFPPAGNGSRFQPAVKRSRFPPAANGTRFLPAANGTMFSHAANCSRFPPAANGFVFAPAANNSIFPPAANGLRFPLAANGSRFPSAANKSRFPPAANGSGFPAAANESRFPPAANDLRVFKNR